jgi:ABC-type phosphate/phosphonate transport system permease subunit
MKRKNIKFRKKIIKATNKLTDFKNEIIPTKIYYVWEKNNLTKVETFSV